MNQISSFKRLISQQINFFMSVPALLWQILFLGIPLVAIFVMSFLNSTGDSYFFTLSNYTKIFQSVYAQVIGRSALLATITASACLMLAYPIVYFLIFYIKRLRNFLLFLLVLPFWTSLLVQAYAWFFVLEKYGLINSLLLKLHLISEPLHILNTQWATYIASTYCYLPFMILPLYTSMEKIDHKLLEASADLGATRWKTTKNVILPLSFSGIRTGLLLVFVPCFGEFVIPSLLGGAKFFYIGSMIEQYFLVSKDIYTGAAFTCISALVLLMCAYAIYRFFSVSTHQEQSPHE